ncbi:MAG: sulfatase-like hydrolase/transferase [Candidatus Hydrogenedens sp.]|nr:sulfatase-like hydrolase/transferase [Candidatus Hydrogenedens sp.]
MKRLLAALFAGLACIASGAQETRRPPNVILVMSDDQGYGELSCHGNPILKTPHLDALHEESVRLTDFHVDPTCSPTRSALLTGRYSIRTGVWHTIMGRSILRRDETTMAQVFQANGYRTGMWGKWHLGDNYPYRPQDRGFEETLIHGGGGVGQAPDFWGNDYAGDTYMHNGAPEAHTGYCTDVWFDAALRFIEKNADRPFFAYLPTNAPHAPYIVPEQYAAPYRQDGVVQPEFYGMIANFDENMGKLLQRIDELGLRENTIVIYMTDNGSAAGANVDKDGFVRAGYNAGMRGKKGMPYEGGHRVPFFIRWPGGGLEGGRDIDRLTAHIDLLPTLIELCGLKLDETPGFDGRSMRGLLTGTDTAWPERTLCNDQQRIEHPEKGRNGVAMTQQWRLVNGKQLFDVESDPGQQHDVSGEHPDVVARLQSDFDQWWDSVSQRFGEYNPITIGGPENPTRLGSMYIHGDPIWDQDQVLAGRPANGFWAIDVARPGTYRFALRRWPAESGGTLQGAVPGGKAIPFTTAKIRVGETEQTIAITPDNTAVLLELPLEPGETRLQTWLETQDGQSQSAYYVYAERVGE